MYTWSLTDFRDIIKEKPVFHSCYIKKEGTE